MGCRIVPCVWSVASSKVCTGRQTGVDGNRIENNKGRPHPMRMPEQICLLDGHQMIAKEEASVSESFQSGSYDQRTCTTLELWRSEAVSGGNPNLWRTGDLIEIIPYQVGLTICIEDGIIKLNGRRLIINGVNRHEWNAKVEDVFQRMMRFMILNVWNATISMRFVPVIIRIVQPGIIALRWSCSKLEFMWWQR